MLTKEASKRTSGIAPGVRGSALPSRLVLLVNHLGLGGAERQLITLAESLDRDRFNVAVVTYRPVPPGVGSLTVPDGILHHALGSPGVGPLRLAWTLRRLNPTWVYSFMPAANLRLVLCRPFLGGVRVIAGVRVCCTPDQLPLWRDRVFARAEQTYLRWADVVISNSNAAADLLQRSAHGPVNVRVVPNGVDTRLFRPDPVGGSRLRGQWGVPVHSPLIGIAARFDHQKNHELFLRAAAMMPVETHFVCMGAGPVERTRSLYLLAQALGLGARVHFVGQPPDMHAAYSALSLSTLSSRFEGFPNALAEAMACGTPCVGTDVGDVAFLLGATGLTVPADDASALAAAWLEALGWERSNAGTRARQRILSEFAHDALAERTANILESLL